MVSRPMQQLSLEISFTSNSLLLEPNFLLDNRLDLLNPLKLLPICSHLLMEVLSRLFIISLFIIPHFYKKFSFAFCIRWSFFLWSYLFIILQLQINEKVTEDPSLVNADPETTWFLKIRVNSDAQIKELFTEE